MKNRKINKINEESLDLPKKYEKANAEFKMMLKNIPDFSKMEPIEIYNWVEKLVKLTKV